MSKSASEMVQDIKDFLPAVRREVDAALKTDCPHDWGRAENGVNYLIQSCDMLKTEIMFKKHDAEHEKSASH